MPCLATPPARIFGCDVGKTTIAVFDASSGRAFAVDNEPEALSDFAAALDASCFVVCEATGGYENALLAALLAAGVPAHRADARKVKAFIRSFGTLAKTDRIDARALARYGKDRSAELALWQAPQAERDRLKKLVLLRRDLVAGRLAWANRRDAPGQEAVQPRLAALIAAFDQELRAVEEDIGTLIEACRPVADAVKALIAIPGVGHKTAAALLALMPELGSLSRRKAASLAGLAPHPVQSGLADAYRSTRGGRAEVKRVLFMAALAARKHNPSLRAFYDRLVENGKKPLVAITAVMRKLVVIANAKLRPPPTHQLS